VPIILKTTPQYLRARAVRCREAANLTADKEAARALTDLAREFDAEASMLEADMRDAGVTRH
jgi:hypothetical protein